MDDRVSLVGVPKIRHESAHAVQVELAWQVAEVARQAVIDKAVQIIQGGLGRPVLMSISLGIVLAAGIPDKRQVSCSGKILPHVKEHY